MTDHPSVALTTVCTQPFLPGTLVMLRSFLDHNPWFTGEVIILTDEPTPAMRSTLEAVYPVRFRPVGEQLLRNATEVRRAVTDRDVVEVRFFALELFALSGYDKVLYLDSDVLVVDEIRELVFRSEPFLVVGDGFHYRDKVRTGPEYHPHRLRFWQRHSDYWSGLFNSGVLVVDATVTTPEVYADLVALVDPVNFREGGRRYHDQKLLNVYFYGKTTLVSARYNYRFGITDQIMNKDGVGPEGAAIYHFTARRKPWIEEHSKTTGGASAETRAAAGWWECWRSLPEPVRTLALENIGDE